MKWIPLSSKYPKPEIPVLLWSKIYAYPFVGSYRQSAVYEFIRPDGDRYPIMYFTHWCEIEEPEE